MRSSLRELVHYGAPRVPGDLAAAGMYAIGPILVAHQIDLQAAGLLAVGMSLITVLSAAFGPIGLVLLPRLSQQLADNRESEIRARLPVLVGATVLLASSIAIAGALFGNTWMSWILNDSFSFQSRDLALLMIAAGANVVFVVLRSLIDAAEFRPLNAVHTTVSLGVLLLVWVCASQFRSTGAFPDICLAIAASFVTLAVLTLQRVSKRFELSIADVMVGVRDLCSGRFLALRRLEHKASLGSTPSPEASCETAGHEGCTDKVMHPDSRRAEEDVERSYR